MYKLTEIINIAGDIHIENGCPVLLCDHATRNIGQLSHRPKGCQIESYAINTHRIFERCRNRGQIC